MKFVLKLVLVLVSLCGFAVAQKCDTVRTSTCMDGKIFVVVGMLAEPRSLTGAHEVDLQYANKFRYSVTVSPSATTPIAAAKVPSQFGPSGSTIPAPSLPKAPAAPGAALADVAELQGGSHPNALIQTLSGSLAATVAIPTGEAACNQTTPAWPTGPQDRIDRINNCWLYTRRMMEKDRSDVRNLALRMNTTIRSVADEQSCYQDKLKNFSDSSLSRQDAGALVTFAQNNTAFTGNACATGPLATWPDAGPTLLELSKGQDALTDLTTAPGYPDWIKQAGYSDANAALVKQTAALMTEATSYATGAVTTGTGEVVTQNRDDWEAVQRVDLAWRNKLAAITNIDSLEFTIPSGRCNDFYGKGHTTAATVSTLDLSSSDAKPQTLTLANNTCLPATIASTGVGISFLPNPTYGFVAGDTTGAQVIGKTAVNQQAPVFAALYNVKLGRGQHLFPHGMEFFASPGVGFSTASSTAATDFLGGISVSLKRRTLFITPALDFGQRTELSPGFSVGTGKGSLTSVPTVSNWKPGFALIITFGVAPS